MGHSLGDLPTPTCDDGQIRAPGGRDAAPTAKDLSTPRDEPPLAADHPRAAQTPDEAIPDGITSEVRMAQQRKALEEG